MGRVRVGVRAGHMESQVLQRQLCDGSLVRSGDIHSRHNASNEWRHCKHRFTLWCRRSGLRRGHLGSAVAPCLLLGVMSSMPLPIFIFPLGEEYSVGECSRSPTDMVELRCST